MSLFKQKKPEAPTAKIGEASGDTSDLEDTAAKARARLEAADNAAKAEAEKRALERERAAQARAPKYAPVSRRASCCGCCGY